MKQQTDELHEMTLFSGALLGAGTASLIISAGINGGHVFHTGNAAVYGIICLVLGLVGGIATRWKAGE